MNFMLIAVLSVTIGDVPHNIYLNKKIFCFTNQKIFNEIIIKLILNHTISACTYLWKLYLHTKKP
jgi:hypothetical protein